MAIFTQMFYDFLANNGAYIIIDVHYFSFTTTIADTFLVFQSMNYFTIVTGALALCEIKVEVLPKKISLGKPSPREPMTI